MASKPTNARNARHEQDDVSVRRIAKIALAILVSIGVCAA